MKTSLSTQRERGLTLVELLVVIAVVVIFAAMIIPASSHNRARALRLRCVNNLKQTGPPFLVWEGDHGDKYPMDVAETNGGAMEFASGANEFKFFQVMSNELATPKVLLCPAESDSNRTWATNFASLTNSNLSYFIGLNVSESDPQGILLGDRNITNGTLIKNGILELTTNNAAGWTAELHNKVGNILLSDGSVQQLSATGLRSGIANTGVAANRLLMPALQP